jgi:hypothetical protein
MKPTQIGATVLRNAERTDRLRAKLMKTDEISG